MEFDPRNNIVKLCIHGLEMEEKGNQEEAGKLFFQAFNEASSDFEKYLAAHFVARHQSNVHDKLKWTETALEFVLKINDDSVSGALHSLYLNLSRYYEALKDPVNAKRNYELAISYKEKITDIGPFYHGTKADMQIGDLLTPGGISNYKSDLKMNHIYFTALVNGAGLAAALANGDGTERVYIVEPTGSFENDPNVTDKKFPGNPSRSYRTMSPLKIVGEVTEWFRQTPEQIQKWREKLANNQGEIIN
ncbi:MAG: NAD(+)--rifampin ADP-ribosyltransferase [Chitinophagales bacterium]|jgi:tetratricopeptide (TPR) repeat protein|nr:rifampin ADP-ribosyl transferase [uncultured bacterium]MBK7036661.1 NAD(+)--rifampin ADP-ribosyltransferase [Bacteroidota bacterium]MBK7569289.1 NAD(+)--rifampin ADP-ribosyltransferase [Bacteroidota bacterium]MBP9221146.1 NAD(+)--rifampin ADP-ribosyltransferase [Chitinophagales bacterium]